MYKSFLSYYNNQKNKHIGINEFEHHPQVITDNNKEKIGTKTIFTRLGIKFKIYFHCHSQIHS